MRILFVALLVAIWPVAAAHAAPRSAPPPQPWDLVWTIGPPDGDPKTPAPQPTNAMRVLGDALYEAHCGGCHGTKGDGRSQLAAQLRPPPTDFTRAVYKLRSTPRGSLPTDRDLFRTLTRGMHGTAMRPWRALTEVERWALVGKLKSFSTRFRDERPGQPVVVPPAPRETLELDERGAKIYRKMGCDSCHGEVGEVNEAAREMFRRDPSRRQGTIRIRDFTRGRFIRGIEMEDIFLTLRVGVAGTPMAPYEKLPDEDLWALAAHVRSLLRDRPYDELPPARVPLAQPGTDSSPGSTSR
ncbi:MAG TPA: cytochrome c [Polyangia bacterium]